MILPILFLVGGLALVIYSADVLVKGASAVARKLKISELVIGLTIVSMGTSTPELIVNIFASLQGSSDLAIGNILGSNIANILLILGIAALIYPLTVTKGTVWKEIPFSLLAALMVGVMANDRFFDSLGADSITRTDGLALMAFFIIFMYYVYGISREQGANSSDQAPVKDMKTILAILFVVGGIIGLTVGGRVIVDNAIYLATIFGVSEALVGLTIVAIGTSLPELATSAVAAYRKNVDIAVGNIVGSNIFNIFWILGLSSIIKPLPFTAQNNFDALMVIFVSLVLFAFMFIGQRRVLQRWQGAMFLLLYLGYIGFLVIRG